MKPLLALAIASALIGAAPPAARPGPPPRAPNGQWQMDFAETQCLATRNYGSDAEPVTLTLKPSPLGDVFQLAILLRAVRAGPAAEEKPASVQIGDRPALATTLLAVNFRQSG